MCPKKQRKISEVYTQVIPVVFCANEIQVNRIMYLCGIPRANILKNNLGYKVKSRRLAREKATIQNFIRRDLRRTIAAPVQIFAEDLTQPIKGQEQARQINRKLNQWMKGELQASIEKIVLETGSALSVVNPAYTSQVDSLTGIDWVNGREIALSGIRGTRFKQTKMLQRTFCIAALMARSLV